MEHNEHSTLQKVMKNKQHLTMGVHITQIRTKPKWFTPVYKRLVFIRGDKLTIGFQRDDDIFRYIQGRLVKSSKHNGLDI